MNHIDILDNEIAINGNVLTFPMSYAEVKSVFGDARIEKDKRNWNYYIYDQLGLYFREGNVEWLKKQQAYKDADHIITSVYLYVAGDPLDGDIRPARHYVGNVTFFGKKKEHNILNRFMGCYQDYIRTADGELEMAHVGAYVSGKDDEPNYVGDLFRKSLNIIYKPRKPKTAQNYVIQNTDETCLVFDTFNFKLAVINELMYEQEILKPHFDIYEFMDYKKAHWDLETGENVEAAVQFFKDLPIPAAYADKVTTIYMDGGNEIYLNIAPLWDGEDDRFDIDNLTERELRQFPNLKSMTAITTELEKLQKICGKCGIEVSLLQGDKIYVGVCVDTACTLGVCAERNAIFNMITNGENAIKRVIAINRDGKTVPPCGACREFMTQLMPETYRNIEIMMDYENGKIMTLGELTPEWWL